MLDAQLILQTREMEHVMSSVTLEKLRSEVLRLPESARAKLAHELVKSLL